MGAPDGEAETADGSPSVVHTAASGRFVLGDQGPARCPRDRLGEVPRAARSAEGRKAAARHPPRALRKRRAVEAFVHLSRGLLMGDGSEQCECRGVIVDAASGAGNLSIPLSGLLGRKTTVLAIDVNEVALHRLKERDASVKVLCADLAADIDLERFGASMVVSLHGCGAATDMAIRLATRNRLPFVVSPCCTAKAVNEEDRGLSSTLSAAQEDGRRKRPRMPPFE